jgi:hypothetical protein
MSGTATVYTCRDARTPPPDAHQQVTHESVAGLIASLKGACFGGECALAAPAGEDVYLVPHDTLLADELAELRLDPVRDLFGGVVPHGFVATKAICHDTIGAGARPPGWSAAFAEEVREVVLPGFSVFCREDALCAGRALLSEGGVRVKPPEKSGGYGQTVLSSEAELEAAVEALEDAALASAGLVLEPDLQGVVTYSVGQVVIDGLRASYWGTQSQTRDNEGRVAYGGSALTVVRGGFEDVLGEALSPEIRQAILQALVFDRAARVHYGADGSRRNYDVLHGADARGALRSGVVDQSWRIGGASASELLALTTLRDQPGRRVVRVQNVERFGAGLTPPPGAVVQFSGVDPALGPLLKYALVGD